MPWNGTADEFQIDADHFYVDVSHTDLVLSANISTGISR
jgi:hypothetical protein